MMPRSFLSDAEDFEVFGDLHLDLGQLFEDLLDLHPGEALQLHLDDGLRLPFSELERPDQAVARFARAGGRADQFDHRVQVFDGFLEAEQNVLALPRLAQQVIRAAANNIDAMIDEALEHIRQAQLARLPVDDGQHDHAEVDLELGVLVEIVEHHFGLLAALQLEDDAHAVAIAFVANFGDAFQPLLVHQAGRRFNQARLVHLVRNFGDDDGLAILAELFDGGFGAQLQRAAALGEVIEDALASKNESAGGEIRALHQIHDFAQMRFGLLHQKNGGVDDLGDIVRRDIGGHPHRDARRSVDQQIRNARGQNFGLHAPLIEVRTEIDGLFVEIFQQRGIDPREPRFGVPIRRGRIAIHRTEVALAIHQRIAQRKILRHANQRVIHRRVAVRMVIAEHFADDARAFAVRPVEREPHLPHRIKNAAMHGLQTVADVGQRAPDDHAHGVVEIRTPHLVFDVDGDQVLLAFATERHLGAVARRSGRLRWGLEGLPTS